MTLLPATPAQRIASELDGINSETVSFLRAQMRRAYDLANTPGEEQAIMDAFGPNAAAALTIYATLHSAITALGAADGLPAPDFERFVADGETGSVLYVAPPAEAPPPLG